MSGGTPTGANFMRQRHSWGYASGGEDLEDDACSKPMPSTPSIQRAKSWVEIMETFLWIASAMFIVYFGDWHSNLIYVLWHDDRIMREVPKSSVQNTVFRTSGIEWEDGSRSFLVKFLNSDGLAISYPECGVRVPLYLGFVGVFFSVVYFFYTSMSTWGIKKSNENWEILGASALPFVTLLGFTSFCLFTWALWPIWSFLTLPLVFTLFMACTVVSPYLITTRTSNPQPDVLRLD